MHIWTIQRRKKYRGHDTKGRQTKWITTQKSKESYKDEQHDPPPSTWVYTQMLMKDKEFMDLIRHLIVGFHC